MRPSAPALTSDQTLFARDFALNALRLEHPVTRRVIDAIPLEKGHYRGQLSMYLRPMGAKVPSMYGESYDSAQARKEGA